MKEKGEQKELMNRIVLLADMIENYLQKPTEVDGTNTNEVNDKLDEAIQNLLSAYQLLDNTQKKN